MKSQKTIDNFFKIENNGKEVNIRKYFYIKWTNKFNPDIDAIWLIDRPEKINFIQHVNCEYIKKGYYFYICGYFENYEEEEYKIYKEIKYKNVSLLKSHLQKNIRRQDTDRAISTSLHLMKLDMNEFLRRFIVIHIEDTFLNKSLTSLVWLMIAYSTKKFKMKKYIYEWLLGFVYMTNITKKVDDFNKKIKNMNNKIFKTVYDELCSYENLDFTNEQISIIYSFHIRIAYGTMKSDKLMFEKYINLWKTRFINKTINFNSIKIKPINIFVSELPIEMWDYCAVDFHTNSNFIDLIFRKYPDLDSYDEIKKIIWYNSSSINKRKINNGYKVEKWDEIKNYVINMQKYLLETNY